MDFFFCLPILFGCKTTVKPDGDQIPRVCPRCNNAAVISAKSRDWFEICFVPLIPMSSKHIWTCSICQWSMRVEAGGWEPTPVGQAGPPPAGYYPPNWQQAHYPPANQYQYQPQTPSYGPPQVQQQVPKY
ncbi:hypothetical protein D9611_004553 [Ephemerocybe angulata]|uniref:Uncharacterized protein n=2 Tax=Ephemerocybe angulata TaxID=980116 RepID=A0A8H5BJY6_9AGAR|nr:hypothetical protein D9611_004553 [Tulosesus angulatus]KAF6765054.1 hypothetical protein DFP72DRAFT_869922 [Tulosesus angulatus]